VGDQRHAPAALLPGKTRYPLYRRLGGPDDRSGRVPKISPPPGFDPLNVQPVASRYTDWAIPAHLLTTVAGVSVGKACDLGKPGKNDKGKIRIHIFFCS
jgi:hypothetical protein